MESWISDRIRSTARRRFITWALVLIAGAWLATSDHRYVANIFRGPFPLKQADLDSIADVEMTPRSFIPTGKTYEAIVNCYGGTATIPGKEQRVHEVLEFVQQRAPCAIFGFGDELAATFTKRQQDFANDVEQRRRAWEQQKGQA